MDIEDINWNSYFIEGTNVLKNKLGITDYDELKKKEYEITLKRLVELHLSPIDDTFDAKHLRDIHKYLFGDIFEFAGEYRIVNTAKNFSSPFADYRTIDKKLNECLSNIDEKVIGNAHSSFLYAEALAKMYYELIQIHPFREGNGRTIREFVREYVESRNKYFNDVYYELDFNNKNVDKSKLFEGTISRPGQIGYLVIEFYNALIRKEKEKVSDHKKY